MRFTTFTDQRALRKAEHNETFDAFVNGIANAPEFATKTECHWISLAVYGDTPTDKGCLRHAANLQAITGIEGDFDRGDVSIEQAAEMARAAGLKACFYTTASHRADFYRWRVLSPLAREYPLSARGGFLDRLNGLLGGVLAGESWTPSQGFFIGRVRGVEYKCLCT
ncbi:MAG: hypothetical protein ABL897_11655 [Hyphomicrobium sp.]